MRDNSYTNRCVTVTVFREDGTGVEIKEPACIEGQVVLDRTGNPNESVIQVINADEQFRGQVRRDEFKLIRVEAGHGNANNKAIIFEGHVIRSVAEDPRVKSDDIITVIYAGEGQISFRFATLETVFAAGTTPIQMVRQALTKMTEITEGNLSGLEGCAPIVRPYPVYGSVREFFNDLAETCDCRWSMQRTSLDFIKNDGVNGQFTVTRKTCPTGLFGSSLTERGVMGICLLDPSIRPNGVVEIQNIEDDSANGFWRVDRIEHEFSTYAGGRFQSEFTGQKLSGDVVIEGTQERLRFSA